MLMFRDAPPNRKSSLPKSYEQDRPALGHATETTAAGAPKTVLIISFAYCNQFFFKKKCLMQVI